MISLLSQVPDPTEIVKAATAVSWTYGLLVITFIAAMSSLVWLVRSWINQAGTRETALTARLVAIEDFQRNEMTSLAVESKVALVANTAALIALTDRLKDCPCATNGETNKAG